MKLKKVNVKKFFEEESSCSSKSSRNGTENIGESRGKHWVFTINNYTEDDIKKLRDPSAPFSWIIFQGEIGSNGTRHLQGAVSFESPKRLGQLRQICGGRGHYELRRGTADQAAEYCRKEESYDPSVERFERGERPVSQGTRTDLVKLAESIKGGADEVKLFSDYPGLYLRYTRGIRDAIRLCSKPRDFKTEVYWYWGPTGTGKSKTAHEKAPMAFWKSGIDNWWDGYIGQEEVIIDDYRTHMCPFNFLLRLLDRYPLLVPVKGGFVNFKAKVIYITTPLMPKETWCNRLEEDVNQLRRRVEHVVHFHNLLIKKES